MSDLRADMEALTRLLTARVSFDQTATPASLYAVERAVFALCDSLVDKWTVRMPVLRGPE